MFGGPSTRPSGLARPLASVVALAIALAVASSAVGCAGSQRAVASLEPCERTFALADTASIAAARPSSGAGTTCLQSGELGLQHLAWVSAPPERAASLVLARAALVATLGEGSAERRLAWYGRCHPVSLQREVLDEKIFLAAAELPWPDGREVSLVASPSTPAVIVARLLAKLEARGHRVLFTLRPFPRERCLDERASSGDRRARTFSAVGGAVANVVGDLAEADITSVMRTTIPELQRCYEYQLGREPKSRPSGKIVVRFYVDRTGAVAKVQIAETTLGRKLVESCVAEAIQGLVFPPPGGREEVIVTYPFVFKVKD